MAWIQPMEVRRPKKVGTPVLVTVVETPACHLCDSAKSTLAALSQAFPIAVEVLSIDSVEGGGPMAGHRATMSPLVLLDGEHFSSGRLPRRKLERRPAMTLGGEIDG